MPLPFQNSPSGMRISALGTLSQAKSSSRLSPASGFCRGVEACEICQLSQDFRCRIPLSQRVQPCIRVPLAEPLPVASQKQREMVKRRCLQSQQPIQQQLSGGGRQQVRTPHYFCDAHGRVIHHHRQLIGKYAVRPPQQKIPAVRRQPLPVLPHVAVGESDLLLRHPQPQGGGAACAPGPLCRLLRGQTAAGPWVDHLSILPVGSTGGMELRPGTEAGVDQPLGLQSPQSSLIQRRPPALLIGAAGAADDRSLVPVQSQPLDVPAHLLPIAPRASRDIQILDPQDHSPALLPGAEPSQQAAQNIPQMDAPAWRRRKPSGHRHGLLPSLSVHATPL